MDPVLIFTPAVFAYAMLVTLRGIIHLVKFHAEASGGRSSEFHGIHALLITITWTLFYWLTLFPG
jgi:hypothetical protein